MVVINNDDFVCSYRYPVQFSLYPSVPERDMYSVQSTLGKEIPVHGNTSNNTL